MDANVGFEITISPGFEKALVEAARPSLERLSAAIFQDMLRLCPVDTGHLKSTIFCEVDRDGNIVGGATADYAEPVERGYTTSTGKLVDAQPFVRPAFMKKRSTR